MKYFVNKFIRNLNKHFGQIIIAIALLLALLVPSASYANENTIKEEINIQTYVSDMQPGWNLGNSFDAVGADETAWGNPKVTKELIEQIAAQGYKSIRIPLTFDQRMSGGPDYTIDKDFLNRIDQVVQWALDEDLYVMINVHHDSWIWLEAGMNDNHDESLARFQSLWIQLAEHYKNHSTKLMFESINEPRFTGDEAEEFAYLKELNTSFHEIIRNSGGHNDVRPLVLPTLDTGSEQHKLDDLSDTIQQLNDPNLIATVHYYGFWPFSVNVAGYTRFDEETKNDIINTFDRVHNSFVANGIPVILGEYGLLGFDTHTGVIQQGEKLKFFEFMIHYAQEKNITHMLWDNGQHFGRQSFEWSDPLLYTMMKKSWDSRSATAESDFIYLKKDEEVKDVSLHVDLHGNQFEALLLNDEELVKEQDFKWDGENLTFKASLLSKLTDSEELGTNATLKATFNHGADWHFNIITYEKPTIASTKGTTSEFSIPTVFNGDRLATVEAVYPDGSFAGPQNWTSFKEFGYAFSPHYETNEITFPERFFNEIQDGDVHLTFHFWSGETLPYTLTKDGANVTGVYEDETSPDKEEDKDPTIPEDDSKPEEENKDDEDNTPSEDNKNENINNDDSNTNDEDRPSKNPNDASSDKGKPSEDLVDNSNENNVTPIKDIDEKEINKNGNQLPNTATAHYNVFFFGLLLLALGTLFVIYARKAKMN